MHCLLGSPAAPSPVTPATPDGDADFVVGETLRLTAKVVLGPLEPPDVAVEAYFGPLRADGYLSTGRGVPMAWTGYEDGLHVFVGEVPCRASGQQGYAVRVLPSHEDVLVPNELPLITWE